MWGFWSFGRLAEGAEDVHVAVMVPDTPRGPGRRGAGVGPHGRRAAGSPGRPGPKGLEGALADRDRHTVGALDLDDQRVVTVWVAGSGAGLVAKAHKIAERVGVGDRVRDKVRSTCISYLASRPIDELVARLQLLSTRRRTTGHR